MSVPATIQPSFAAGEISPQLYGRVDQALYKIGTRKMRNFFVHPGGATSNRAGTQFIGEVNDSTVKGRLFPFQFNDQVTYVLEFGDQIMRVIKCAPGGGGYVLSDPSTIYSIPTPYAAADLAMIKYTQSNDTMTFTHTSYPPVDLTRTGDASWTFTNETFAPQIAAPTGLTGTGTAGSVVARYRVTALNAQQTEESLPALWTANAKNVTGATQANPCVVTLSAMTGIQAGDEIEIDGVVGMTELNGNRYTLQNISGATAELRNFDNTNVDSTAFGAYASGGTATQTFIRVTLAAPTTSAPITIKYNAVTGAPQYNIYKEDSGIFGYIGTSNTLAFNDTNIKPDDTQSPPGARNPFANGNYPGTVAYHEQRKFYAGSTSQPQTLWATQTGNFKNMNVSSPSQADDAITRTLVASQVNTIKHMVSFNVLIMLTTGAEWKVFPGSNNDALEPGQCYTKPQTYNGCSDTRPLVVDNSILFVQKQGNVVRDIVYDFASDSYTGSDRSVWSNHLFAQGLTITEWGFAQSPYRIAWAIRSDGALLGFTYMKEQQVYAWHRHDTNGVFESVAVVTEGTEDVPYFLVRRTINGVQKRYVERLHSRQFADVTECWFSDCALQYSGPPTAHITGLDHLIGETVSILADGNVFAQQVVANDGSITLDQPISSAIVGLPIQAELETLDLDAGDPTIQGKRKMIPAVTVKVNDSRGIKIGGVLEDGTYGKAREVKEHRRQMYGTPIGLIEGEERILMPVGYNRHGRVFIRQDNPLPCTIMAVIPEVAIGDN